MITQIADLHIHSKYSRACSPLLELPNIAAACVEKGIDIVATGDFTHPSWLAYIEENLEEIGATGLYRLKKSEGGQKSQISNHKSQINSKAPNSNIKFILSTEISCIYKHRDKTRRLHLVILAPNLDVVSKFNAELVKMGVNIKSDGRPMMGLSAKTIVQICLDIDERIMVIPAHAWTPWFAVFGSKSGYDSLEDCFEELTPHIRAIETGLSSDPTMNHRLTNLDRITLISNSDAHSLDKLGREANVFVFASEAEVTYQNIKKIIESGDRTHFLFTIEFYPEEGMYHVDGHRECGVSFLPAETKRAKFICPKCKKPLTVGVLHRVEDLADRSAEEIPAQKFIPHKYIVPLREVIGSVLGVGVKSKKVENEYRNLLKNIGNEFHILLDAPLERIEKFAGDKNIATAIKNMRTGAVIATPGFDGQYGTIDFFGGKKSARPKQTSLL